MRIRNTVVGISAESYEKINCRLLALRLCGWRKKVQATEDKMIHTNRWEIVRFGVAAKALSSPVIKVSAEILCIP